jgi:hypothetical protein
MTARDWRGLETALARWGAQGRRPLFWLRDDDAVAATDQLRRLLDLAARFDVPVALAVIPEPAEEGLAAALATRSGVDVLVHGWAHSNHAPAGQKKQELGLHRPADVVLDELARGLARARHLFGAAARPILVPPWNRIDPALLPRLPALGYAALSVFGSPKPAPIAMLNTTVDLIDWHGTRSLREPAALLGEIVEQLDAGLDEAGGGLPIGILTHHLVHDAAIWGFLRDLLDVTTRGGGAWAASGALLARAV